MFTERGKKDLSCRVGVMGKGLGFKVGGGLEFMVQGLVSSGLAFKVKGLEFVRACCYCQGQGINVDGLIRVYCLLLTRCPGIVCLLRPWIDFVLLLVAYKSLF